MQNATDNFRIVFVNTTIPDQPEGQRFNPHLTELAYESYFQALADRDLATLTEASHQLNDSGALFGELIQQDTSALLGTLYDDTDFALSRRHAVFYVALQSYIYGVPETDIPFRNIEAGPVINAQRALGLDRKILISKIRPTDSFIKHIRRNEGSPYEDEQFRFLGKQAIKTLGLQRYPRLSKIFQLR